MAGFNDSISSSPGGIAVVFPGQGSQTAAMAAEVASEAPELRRLANELMGVDPFEHLAEGTRYVQPAVFAASVASWLTLNKSFAPAAVAGHSLGEIAALVAGSVISVEDGARIAVERGTLTESLADGRGMMAVLKLDTRTAEQVLDQHNLILANRNAPGEIVASGTAEDLAAAETTVRSLRGGTVRLAINGAFHTPALAPLVPRFSAFLEQIEIRAPTLPVFCSTTARPFTDPLEELPQGLTRPVLWTDTIRAMIAQGIDCFIEAAPGNVLTKLIRRIAPEVRAFSAHHVLAGEAPSAAPIPAPHTEARG